MAILDSQAKQALHQEFIHGLVERDEKIGLTKAELQAAYTAVDQWLEDNKAALNQAIPQPARGALTASQKAALLMEVIRRRFKVGA